MVGEVPGGNLVSDAGYRVLPLQSEDEVAIALANDDEKIIAIILQPSLGTPYRDRLGEKGKSLVFTAGSIVGCIVIFLLFAVSRDNHRRERIELALRGAQEEIRGWNAELQRRVDERSAQLEQVHSQLLASQKMEGLGRLAGGIAHDFNSVVMAVRAHRPIYAR